MTTLLFPFADVLVKISGMVVKEKAEEEPVAEDAETAATLKHLDERIFESPAFAVETAALRLSIWARSPMRMWSVPLIRS